MKKKLLTHITPLMLLVICLLIMGFLSIKTQSFFSMKNVINILEANSYRLILAVGMMLIISSGAIDLSVGSIVSVSAIFMAKALKAELPVPACISIGLLTGAFLGAINGAAIHYSRINPFIITLATSYMYRGLSLIITGGIPITKLPQAFRTFGCGDILGMESGVTMAVVIALMIVPLFYYMRWGSYLRSMGGNPQALHRTGVKVSRYRISSYMLMGIFAAVVGIIITARLNSAEPNAGMNMEMDAICAVIMGGTSLHGGDGSLLGTVIAVFLMGLIRNGLTIMSISPYYQQFITGAILLIAVVIAEIRSRRSRMDG